MKRIITITTALLLCLCMVSSAYAGSSFPDVASSAWYAEFVDYAVDAGMVEGYPDGTFRPDKLLKYSEFIAMMVEQQTTDELICQIDTGHWGVPYYNMGLKLGYFSEGDISVRVLDDPIPRRDMAVIAAGYLEKNADIPSSVPFKEYADVTRTDPDEYYISVCSCLGVLEGYEADGTFRPDKTLKRSEAVKVAVCCDKLKKQAQGTVTPVTPPVTPVDPPATGYFNEDTKPAEQYHPGLEVIEHRVGGGYNAKNVSGLIPAERKAVMDQIMSTFKVVKENGKFYFCYEQPQIPDNWDIEIICHIYNEEGGGIDGYANNKGAFLRPEVYAEARKAKTVKAELTKTKTVQYGIIVDFSISENDRADSNPFGSTSYKLIIIDPEGEPDSLRIRTAYGGFGYYETIFGNIPEGMYAWK